MRNNELIHKKSKPPSRIIRYIERTFLEKKLDNGTGYVLVGFLAIVMGYLLARQMPLGLGLVALSIGLTVVLICMLSTETGFYINMVYSFFVYTLTRFPFGESIPVGVITDVLIIAMLFSFFIRRDDLREDFNRFIRTPVVLVTILLYFYLLIQLFNPEGHSFEAWIQTVRRSIETLIFLFISYRLLNTKEHIKRYIKWLFFLCVVTGFYGCIQQWHGLFDFEMRWVMADETRFGLDFIGGEFRKFSTFNDPTAFGIVMASCSVFFTIIAMAVKNKREKRILLAGVVIMILAMAYSGTRTANVMLMAGFVMFILLTFDKKPTRVFAFIGVILFLIVMFIPVYNNNTINRFRTSFVGSEDESYKVREMSRAFIQPYIHSHPIGGGLETTGAHGVALNPGHYLAGFQTDSGYLKIVLETGWIGLGLICILFFLILKSGIEGYFIPQGPRSKAIYAGAISALFCFYVAEFAQDAIGQITDMVVYYPLIAIILKLKYLNVA